MFSWHYPFIISQNYYNFEFWQDYHRGAFANTIPGKTTATRERISSDPVIPNTLFL